MASTPRLASLNRDLYGIARRAINENSNQGLLFGGTTEAEFNFLSGLVANSTAPNMASLFAGISAGNLAYQQQQQTNFDRAVRLRDQNLSEQDITSTTDLRGGADGPSTH